MAGVVWRLRFGDHVAVEKRARRWWIAVAGALALHALLIVAISWWPREKAAAPPRPKVLQVELRRLEPPKATPRAEPGPSLPEPTPRRRVTDAERRSGAAPPAAPAAPQDANADRWREWRESGIDRSGGRLKLQLDHPESAIPGSGKPDDGSSGLVREKSREEQLAEEKATVSRRIEGWLSDEKAKRRAETGRDAYWQAVEDRLRNGFDPGWDVFEQGPKVARSPLGLFFDTWQKQAETYGRTGNPFAAVPGAPGTTRPLNQEFTALANQDRGLGDLSLQMMPNLLTFFTAGGTSAGETNGLVALVRITLREDGSIFAVELAGSSHNRAYDRLALAKARSLSTLHLGIPPALVTLWAFETEFTQVPPLPIAGCALDDFVPKNCWTPLQKRIRSRVRLVAIF